MGEVMSYYSTQMRGRQNLIAQARQRDPRVYSSKICSAFPNLEYIKIK
jgi:hypothetical protein